MNDPATMHTGPLGSTIHVLRADAGTIAELAAIDWNRHFPRVCLDPVRGVITLMAPSRLHEDLSDILGDIVKDAGSTIAGAIKSIRSTRLRGRGEPPGTGMEPDCAFYVGERARGYLAALVGGEEAADAYVERIAPDLVVEVEITRADAGKIERYGALGVRELWRLHGRKGTRELRAEFLALRSRQRAASSGRLGGARRAHARGRLRGGGRGAVQPDPRRTDGGGGPDRAPAAAGQRVGGRGGGAVPRGSRPSGERAGIRSFMNRIGVRKPKDITGAA